MKKIGRNDPCSCGSGKKYKQCCQTRHEISPTPATASPEAPAPRLLQVALAHHQAGRLSEAEAIYRQILGAAPEQPDALHFLGVIAHQLGRNEIAVELISKAISFDAKNPVCYFHLGNALQALGKQVGAVENYQRALALRPNFAEALSNLGNAFRALGKLEAALASYQRAIALKPDFAQAYCNLGVVQQDAGWLQEAEKNLAKALTLMPGYAEALSNLGNVLKEQGRLDEAVARLEAAIDLRPDYVEAHINLGSVFKEQGRFDAAIEIYRNSILLRPDNAEAYFNLGNAEKDEGKFAAAVEHYRRALDFRPDYLEARSNLLFTLSCSPICSTAEYLAEARDYGALVSSRAHPYGQWPVLAAASANVADTPLRVGVVSGDLRTHPVGYFLESLLAHVNPERMVLLAYPTNRKEDALTVRIKGHFSAWRPIAGMGDEAAAEMIHADALHILIDLAGHTALNRLPLFAWRPAPVQLSWLGYFASTGVREIDYLLVDAVGMPPALHMQATESVRYLPDTRLCFTPPDEDVPVAPLPALKNGQITFGSFQSLVKIGDAVLAQWACVLDALPGARLRLQNSLLGAPEVREGLLRRLRASGIDPDRVSMHGPMSRNAYLAAHAEVDMLLDTFPYPGGTTTCEALWMGVPTLTLAGDTLLSRQGASLLCAAGLADWVVTAPGDYVRKAIGFANDLPMLAGLRDGLRARVVRSPLFDARKFAESLENSLLDMWREKNSPR